MDALDDAMSPPTTITWLGDPPPAEQRPELEELGRLQPWPAPGAQLCLVWSHLPPDQLAPLRASPTPPRLVVVSPNRPGAASVRAWTERGAVAMVEPGRLVEALRALLPAPCPEESADDPGTFDSAVSSGAVDPSSLVWARVDGADPFPPLRRAGAPAALDEAAQRYLVVLDRYLERREEVLAAMGPGALSRYLELGHLREQVPTATGVRGARLDPYGRSRSGPELDWEVLVRRFPSRGAELELSEGRIHAVGTDGLVLLAPFAASPRQRLLLDLPMDASLNAQLICEARWQRRVGVRRWHVGALILDMRRRTFAR